MNKAYLLLLLGIFIAGCQKSPQQVTIFENAVCQPPCWENITPGVTTKEDALAILEKVTAGGKPVIDRHESGQGYDDAIEFAALNDPNNYTGSLYISNDQVLLISFDIYTSYPGIRLDHSIELFGEPQSVLVTRGGEFEDITLLNFQTGISFGYRLTDSSSRINPDTEIRHVSFFNPHQYEQLLNAGMVAYYSVSPNEILNRMRPWNGYGDLSQYEK